MNKNKLIVFSIVSLLGLGFSGTISELTNVNAQAKSAKVDKKKHKKHTKKKLSKHEKLLQEIRDQINHPNKYKKKATKDTSTQSNDKIVDGYNETTQKINDMSTYINVATQTSINKLNSFRQSQGLKTLTVDDNLTKITKLRAQQVAEQGFVNASHYNSQGQFLGAVDAQQLNVMSYDEANNTISENIGVYSMDTMDTPVNLGNQSVDDAINEGPTGGHYKNIANSNSTKCGVGFYITSDGIIGYVLELQ